MLDLLFPRRCVLCDRSGGGLCTRCADQLEPPPARVLPSGLDDLITICAYRGAGRELVLALKRGNRRAAVPMMGAAIADAVRLEVPRAQGLGITWAPTTNQRARERGFDQAQVLAQAVARPLGASASRRLERLTGAQMGHDAAHRVTNPRFRATSTVQGTWLVIDDVVTTGATLTSAAGALRAAGAASVIAAVVASAAAS